MSCVLYRCNDVDYKIIVCITTNVLNVTIDMFTHFCFTLQNLAFCYKKLICNDVFLHCFVTFGDFKYLDFSYESYQCYYNYNVMLSIEICNVSIIIFAFVVLQLYIFLNLSMITKLSSTTVLEPRSRLRHYAVGFFSCATEFVFRQTAQSSHFVCCATRV